MIDRLQSVLALTLSILIHASFAFFGDIQIGQSGAGKSGPLSVTVASLSQPAAATSVEDSSLAGVKAVESILDSETESTVEDSESTEPTEPTEVKSSIVDQLEAKDTAPVPPPKKLDTPIHKVEKPVKPEPTLAKAEPQVPIATKTSPSSITPPLTDNATISDSISPISKTETVQPTDAETIPRSPRPPLKKSAKPSQRIDHLTTETDAPNAEESSSSETTDTTDLSQSTDQSGGKGSAADTGSNTYFSRQPISGLAKTEKISVPVKTVTTAIPLYHLIPKPPYPSRSRDLGEEGTVIIAILVGADGKVKEAALSKSSGFPPLDGSALATVKEKWQFKPGTRNGSPVESRVRVPIKFSIRDF